jgi:hypothetical protein
MEHVSQRRVGHRIKPYDRHRILEALQGVSHTSEIAMPTTQTPYSPKRLSLRQLLHTSDTSMQRVHLASAPVITQLAPDDSIRVGTFSDALRLSPPLSAAARGHAAGGRDARVIFAVGVSRRYTSRGKSFVRAPTRFNE